MKGPAAAPAEPTAGSAHVLTLRSCDGPGGPHQRRLIAAARAQLSLAAFETVNLIASLALADVYGTWTIWLSLAPTAALLAGLAAACSRLPRLAGPTQVALLLGSQAILGPALAMPGRRLWGFLPSWDLLRAGWRSSITAFKLLAALEPPLGRESGGGMALWTLLLWTGFIGGRMALRAGRRAGAAWSLAGAAACPLTTMAISILLGTRAGWHPATAALPPATALLLWAAWSSGEMERGRLVSKLVCLALSSGFALAASALPADHRWVLRDHYLPPATILEGTSPLSGYRAWRKDLRQESLLTVRGLPDGTPVRLAAMDTFDGQVWKTSRASSGEPGGSYRRLTGAGLTESTCPQPAGSYFQATFQVDPRVEAGLLPTAGQAAGFGRFRGLAAEQAYYQAASATGITDSGAASPRSYLEKGRAPAPPPSRRAIARAGANRVTLPPPEHVPEAVSAITDELAGRSNGADGYRALALADGLRARGWFSHGLAGDHPSPAGHGSHRLAAMLQPEGMIGDDEQYASLLALMARREGLPARVVMGFTPAHTEGVIDAERRLPAQPDPSDRTVFTGDQVEAWVEISLQGLGWVAFHPSPPASRRPQPDLARAAERSGRVRRPPPPLAAPLRETEPGWGGSSAPAGASDPPADPSTWERYGRYAVRMALAVIPVGLCTSLVWYLAAASRRRLRSSRKEGPASRRILNAWDRLIGLARLRGVDASGSRSRQARAIAAALHPGPATVSADDGRPGPQLTDLAALADRAAFSGHACTDPMAARAWAAVDRIGESLLLGAPPARRWQARLFPAHSAAAHLPRRIRRGARPGVHTLEAGP
ncbi:transglutaminase-like domain-containing protein [Bifidobacterium xylocopae]|uniref:Transglutaminase-like domain-containing protein n=1 Tax=Bifidobacterium xylocopae TaxID=2493119 RepID=A0A366KCI9_9BIFI|nr:transglutaminase-like domain-containing protein [Bifidobacterium xylocopae]RBP98952.1 hypothetical protein CRD59_06335 [Bifidobacterium xylocopae]